MSTKHALKIPLLSILIPLFNYNEGLVRIISGFNLRNVKQCEILVYDNSDNDSSEKTIDEWKTKSKCNITYIRNIPAIGPVKNWNNLLDAAKGKFSLLIHHDEFPIGSDFISQLCDKIEKFPEIDIFILDCILVDSLSGRNKRNIPSFIKSLLLKCRATYLHRRNYIGPTATVVCRTKYYPRFDERLIWLVDTDLYVHMFLRSRKYMYHPNIKVGSLQGRKDSITAKISSSLKAIKAREISYLAKTKGFNNMWLNNDLFSKILRSLEFVFWGLMRVFTEIFYLVVNHSALPKSLIDRAIEPINKK
jgi:glycosyltransferase involved in cell wall biosynthesis